MEASSDLYGVFKGGPLWEEADLLTVPRAGRGQTKAVSLKGRERRLYAATKDISEAAVAVAGAAEWRHQVREAPVADQKR